jgi:NitT/TauT family transport system substrate-binding protein
MADLTGRTIYATGQAANPEYVLNFLLEQNGLVPGEDVTVEYMTPDEVMAHMMAGDADLCMLPVPYATTLLLKDTDVRTALSLNYEWLNAGVGSILTQGCVVMRNGALDDGTVSEFLTAYGESIDYMSEADNLDDAAALTVKYGIIGSEEIAKAASRIVNIVFIAGRSRSRPALRDTLKFSMKRTPTSIGGKCPRRHLL